MDVKVLNYVKLSIKYSKVQYTQPVTQALETMKTSKNAKKAVIKGENRVHNIQFCILRTNEKKILQRKLFLIHAPFFDPSCI
jgi:hypothetical protein